MARRSPVLVAIVLYKGFVALLLAATSMTLLLTLKNHQTLVNFAEIHLLEGQRSLIDWFLKRVLALKPKTLGYTGVAAGIYALVTAIEAIGLWYEKAWAGILVVGLVGISIPFEILELIRGLSSLKFVIFLINLAMFGYLLQHFFKRSA